MMTQDDFFNLLEKTAAERPKRPFFVGGEVEWVTHEREVMQAAVNAERRKANLPPLPMDMIRRVEETAMGHSDYTRKFALYCFQLAHDQYEPLKAEKPDLEDVELVCDNCQREFRVKALENEEPDEVEYDHSCPECGDVLCPGCMRWHESHCPALEDEDDDPFDDEEDDDLDPLDDEDEGS